MFAKINLGLPQQWITTSSFSAPAACQFCERLCRQWRVERYATVDDVQSESKLQLGLEKPNKMPKRDESHSSTWTVPWFKTMFHLKLDT